VFRYRRGAAAVYFIHRLTTAVHQSRGSVAAEGIQRIDSNARNCDGRGVPSPEPRLTHSIARFSSELWRVSVGDFRTGIDSIPLVGAARIMTRT
jgi:hypothetical protein